MNKDYFIPLAKIAVVSFILLIVGFSGVWIAYSKYVSAISIAQYVLSSWLVIFIVVAANMVPDYTVTLNEAGARKSGKPQLYWHEIQSVSLDGLRWFPVTQRVVLNNDTDRISINLWIFKDPEVVLAEIARHLPWTSHLNLKAMPAIARRDHSAPQ